MRVSGYQKPKSSIGVLETLNSFGVSETNLWELETNLWELETEMILFIIYNIRLTVKLTCLTQELTLKINTLPVDNF
jgi:hypothetical protein